MAVAVIGGAGFIGSRLARRLLGAGQRVLIVDNLSRGSREHLPAESEKCEFLKADLSDETSALEALRPFHERHRLDMVWHLAANSDIPAGVAEAGVDFRDTFMTVYSVVEAMKKLNIGQLAFASSSAIYGDHGPDVALAENLGPCLPISNYGAMKLAAEAFISASVESRLERAWLFRFPNVVGCPATHGVILDFVRKLKESPATLRVLGDGSQRKAYLHVDDLIEAMLYIREHGREKINLFNIGPEDSGCLVRDIAEAVRDRVSPRAGIVYGSGDRGWVGDVPRFKYRVDKLSALGWRPSRNSLETVKKAVDEIAAQEGF